MKASDVLLQRVQPKQETGISALDEKDDAVLRRIQEIPDVPAVSSVAVRSTEAEPEAVRQARIEARRWREQSLNYFELPGIYARLSKIKLTGTTGHGVGL